MNRDERIEALYHESAWDLAEMVVDLQDKVKSMEDDVKFLAALEAAGVDNWTGYGYAVEFHETGEESW